MKSLVMFGASAALILLSVFVLKPQFQKEKEEKEKSELLWKSARREKMLELSVKAEVPSNNFTLKKGAETQGWIIETPDEAGKNFDADSATVDSLISSILGTKKESDIQVDPAKSGLDVPKFELKLVYTDDDDKKVENLLFIGEDSPVDYQSYAKWGTDKQIFMISKSLKYAIDKKANDLRNKKVFKHNLADFKEIKVSGKRNYSLELGEGGKWGLHLGARKLAADTAALSDWISSLSNAKVVAFPSEDKNNLNVFGLHKPTSTLSFTTLKGELTQWPIGQVKIGKELHTYTTHTGIESIFEMSASFSDDAQKDPQDLRNKRVLSFDKTRAQKITYASKDLQIELLKGKEVWNATHTFKGVKTEGVALKAKVEKLINSLSILRALKFLEKNPKDSSLGLGKKKVEIFETPTAAATASFEVGNTFKDNSTVLWASTFEDPITSILNFAELFPEDATQLIDKTVANKALQKTDEKALDKAPATEATSGSKRIKKLEKTVTNVKELKKLPAAIVEKGAKYSALMTLKDGKKLKIVFAADKAPYTVSNFIHLARNGFYNGVLFHRVISDFVVQGGDPTGTGRGGPGWMFNNEDNDLKHLKGSLSMAHAGRDTNGSQFFIVLAPQPHLDGLHTVFGQVTDGLELIDQIKQGDSMATVEVFEEK